MQDSSRGLRQVGKAVNQLGGPHGFRAGTLVYFFLPVSIFSNHADIAPTTVYQEAAHLLAIPTIPSQSRVSSLLFTTSLATRWQHGTFT